MIIGHLPVGYFTTRYLIKKLKLPLKPVCLGLGLLAAVIPDLDYIYWILSDSQELTHRGLITGMPFFYLTLFIISVIIYCFYKKKWLKAVISIIFINISIHLLIDTVFYGIQWLYPFSEIYIGIYNVGGYGSGVGIQVKNYFTHWCWYAEIVLWIIAIIAVIKSYIKGELK
ncbi:metal-dependent hydrolase [Patescibacteria group bacterium]|nr:metal-dependent hydrolase [Patescibacteria group bacterium]